MGGLRIAKARSRVDRSERSRRGSDDSVLSSLGRCLSEIRHLARLARRAGRRVAGGMVGVGRCVFRRG